MKHPLPLSLIAVALTTTTALAFALPAALAPVDAPAVADVDGLVDEPLHKSAVDPITVELTAPDVIPRGRPFELTATLTAQWADVSGTTLTVELPRGVRQVGPPIGSFELDEGVPHDVPVRLQTAADGLHELRVLVTGSSAVGPLGGSSFAYLMVEQGSQTVFRQHMPPGQPGGPRLTAVDASTVGPVLSGGADAPGPEPAATVHEDVDGLETGASDGPTLSGHSTFQVKVCWFYQDETNTADIPQRFVTVQVWDDDTFGDQKLTEGVTGSDGCYTSANIPREEGHCCDTGNQDIYLEIHMCNTWVCVHDGDGDFYFGTLNFGTVGSQDLIDFGSFKFSSGDGIFASREFQYANNAAWMAVNFVNAPGFSSSGPQVKLEAPSDDGSCPGMFIRRAENRIYVCPGADRSPDDVGHEYGHFVQWKLYEPFWPSPGGPHNLCTDGQDRGLAWAEGFGNWYGPLADWLAGAPGATGDTNYNRPWDGSSFSVDMENGGCAGVGDDNEMRVAHTLWDMVDSAVDGTDVSDTTSAFLTGVVSACNDANFRDFYDGGSCTWAGQGGDPCDLVPAAFQNSVDFNDNAPVGTLTSQGSFAWLKDTITLTATVTDADGFGCPLSADFYLSHNSACNGSDTPVGLDTTAPYARSFDTNAFSDDGSVWACVLTSDGMEQGTSDTSAMFGIDNTAPNVGLSASGTFQNGWFSTTPTMTLGCGDNLSGVDKIEYVVDALGPLTTYTSPFQITGEGVHTLIMVCTDNAGNTDVDVETIRIDTVDPVTTSSLAGTLGNNGWYVSPVEVSIACSDPSPGSGCMATQVATADGIFNCGCPFVVSADGMHEVFYHSVDVAGNVDPTGSVAFDIDQVAPSVTLTGAADDTFSYTPAEVLDGVFTNEGTLNVSYEATDATSGLAAVRVGATEDTFAPLASPVSGTLGVPLVPGVQTLELVAEDQAGHLSTVVSFDVVYIPPGTFDGGVDPRGHGFWKQAVSKGAVTETELGDVLELVNAASSHFGVGETYGEVTPANYETFIDPPKPPSADDRLARALLVSWLNLASGRTPAGEAVDASSVSGWETVITNTDGDPLTTALNAVSQAEHRIDEGPNKPLKNTVRNVLEALNNGDLFA